MLLHYLCLESTREGQAAYTHVNEIARGLIRKGWRVRCFAPYYGDTATTPGVLRRAIEYVRVQWRLCSAGEHPDAIYVRFHFAALPAVLWAKRARIPVIQEVNGPYDDLFLAWPWTRPCARLFRWLMRIQLRWADAIITVTPELAEWAHREAQHSYVHVVPNGANIKHFHPGAEADVAGLPGAYVVFFGALAPWQGIEILLKAVQEPAWPEGVSLVVAGDGVARGKVEHATRTGRVVYLGSVPYRRMPGIVAQAFASVSPQTTSGRRPAVGLSPLKVFESLASGIPVVVTDIPGQADLVRDGGCGLVVPPNNPRSLAEAVAYLYLHPEERMAMGRRGRELAERAHSWDERADEIARIVKELLATKGRHA